MKEYITTQESVLEMEPAFRHVLTTGAHSQLVAMTLDAGEEIGSEVHDDGDQIFIILAGWPVEVTIGEDTHSAPAGSVIMVPQGVRHNVTNGGDIPARILTIYAPAQHPDGYTALTKADTANEPHR
jgi:mannose-6-phosphate isomerase-like protein (cupin superfamily)